MEDLEKAKFGVTLAFATHTSALVVTCAYCAYTVIVYKETLGILVFAILVIMWNSFRTQYVRAVFTINQIMTESIGKDEDSLKSRLESLAENRNALVASVKSIKDRSRRVQEIIDQTDAIIAKMEKDSHDKERRK